ncbi:MAG: endonuclease V, partial [Deltaproteobacteria bacterium]|nr:endonuclease V [Deltaproteobacteria bacterium]
KRIGIASYVGVLLDMPVIGCAKSRLVGEYKEPGKRRGSWSPLKHNGEIVGAVLRTQTGIKPLFISPGHRIDIESSIGIILGCAAKYRLPEPVRRADMLSKKLKRGYKEGI